MVDNWLRKIDKELKKLAPEEVTQKTQRERRDESLETRIGRDISSEVRKRRDESLEVRQLRHRSPEMRKRRDKSPDMGYQRPSKIPKTSEPALVTSVKNITDTNLEGVLEKVQEAPENSILAGKELKWDWGTALKDNEDSVKVSMDNWIKQKNQEVEGAQDDTLNGTVKPSFVARFKIATENPIAMEKYAQQWLRQSFSLKIDSGFLRYWQGKIIYEITKTGNKITGGHNDKLRAAFGYPPKTHNDKFHKFKMARLRWFELNNATDFQLLFYNPNSAGHLLWTKMVHLTYAEYQLVLGNIEKEFQNHKMVNSNFGLLTYLTE
jgi:macrodomain Ter protein organizer (MatP/YcbG family)